MKNTSYSKNDTDSFFASMRQQNEQLKSQLMTNSLIDELTKVLHANTNLETIIHTILLGIHEIAGFDRIILFEVNKEQFSLTPKCWYGVDEIHLKEMNIPLGFEGGDITDAIFLNRHLIVSDAYPEEDIFCRRLQSESYIVIPLVGRTIPTDVKAPVNTDEELAPVLENGNLTFNDIHEPPSNNSEPISENERRKGIINSKDFNTQGVFWMDRVDNKSPITSEDIYTLLSIITQSGIITENIRMFHALEIANKNLLETNDQLKVLNQDLRNAQEKINMDLDHAHTIQQGLLPQNIPNTSSLSISATYIPATAVGGDYYDAFEITQGIYGIIIADVSGHGVASALIMSMVKVLLKTFANRDDGPQKTLEKINHIFQTEIKTTNFVTVFYAILDLNDHKFHYSSAGHCPALFLHKQDKTCTKVKASGLFLGVFPDMMLTESCHSYVPGTQRIILYTDGLTEARNEKGEMFELDRLEQIVLKTLSYSTAQAGKKILTFQKKFCGKNQAPDDDITFLVIDF